MKSQLKPNYLFSNRDLVSLILPLILEQTLAITVGMADTMMVSSAGEAAVSAVSLIDNLSFLLTTTFSAFATGGSVVVSQYLGAKNEKNAKDSAKNLVYLSMGFSIAIVAIILPFKGQIIDGIYGMIESDVRAYAEDYLLYIALSYPFLAIYSALAALSRSEQKSTRTMTVSALMNVPTIGISY